MAIDVAKELKNLKEFHPESDPRVSEGEKSLSNLREKLRAKEKEGIDLEKSIREREEQVPAEGVAGVAAAVRDLSQLQRKKSDVDAEFRIYEKILAQSEASQADLVAKVKNEITVRNHRVVAVAFKDLNLALRPARQKIEIVQDALALSYLSGLRGFGLDRLLLDLVSLFDEIEAKAKLTETMVN